MVWIFSKPEQTGPYISEALASEHINRWSSGHSFDYVRLRPRMLWTVLVSGAPSGFRCGLICDVFVLWEVLVDTLTMIT